MAREFETPEFKINRNTLLFQYITMHDMLPAERLRLVIERAYPEHYKIKAGTLVSLSNIFQAFLNPDFLPPNDDETIFLLRIIVKFVILSYSIRRN